MTDKEFNKFNMDSSNETIITSGVRKWTGWFCFDVSKTSEMVECIKFINSATEKFVDQFVLFKFNNCTNLNFYGTQWKMTRKEECVRRNGTLHYASFIEDRYIFLNTLKKEIFPGTNPGMYDKLKQSLLLIWQAGRDAADSIRIYDLDFFRQSFNK